MMKSQIQIICRNEYSNPPKFGAYLVDLVLSNGTLRKDWKEEIKNMNRSLIDELISLSNSIRRVFQES